jgi:hypothetical protein
MDGEMPPDLMRDRCDGLQASNDNLEFLNHEILFDRTGKTLNISNRDVQQAITDHCIKTGVKVVSNTHNRWVEDTGRRALAAAKFPPVPKSVIQQFGTDFASFDYQLDLNETR